MPNGRDVFKTEKLPELERFFAPIASLLERFAMRHNLRLRKYEKNASWDFEFKHPADGVARIQVVRWRDDAVLVAGLWDYWDLATFRRHTWSRKEEVWRDSPELESMLVSLLREIVTLPPGNLVPDPMDYEEFWKPNLDQIRTYQHGLPLPKL